MSTSSYREFVPKFIHYLKGYNFRTLRKDLFSGVTVGVIALPLAMAFAIASGVLPERGLYTAIIAGFLISLLGGSRYQIGGPTGAFVVIIYDIMQRTGYSGLCLSVLIASILLVLFGVFRLGSLIKFVPHPLITGFTSGIAVIIFSSQIKDFFGLKMGTVPADFIEKWIAYADSFTSFSPITLAFGAGTFAFILCIRRFVPKIPWGIASIVVATCMSALFHLPVETIASRFGEIPRSLPLPHIPNLIVTGLNLQELFLDGITIAFLAGIESLLSAVVADGMTGSRHRSNCELIAQGIANFASILFGGIPATGAIARTAANIKMGAETPISGIIHALTLLLIMACMAPLVSLVPLSALAAVLFVIAWNMSEAHHFIRLLKAPIEDRLVLLSSFLLTVFVDITIAIVFGMILASFFFMKKMSVISKTVCLTKLFQEKKGEFFEERDPDSIHNKEIPSGVEVYEIQGPFFFGAADMLRDLSSNWDKPPKVFILRMRFVPMIDASGAHALKEFYERCHKAKTTLLLSGIHGQSEKDLSTFGLDGLIGEKNIFPHIDLALVRAKEVQV